MSRMMTKISIRKLVVATLAITALVAWRGEPAQAESLSSAVIAVIDTQHIHRTSLAGKDIQVQLDAMRAKFQVEMQKEEEKIRAERDDLERQKDILAPEAIQARTRAFEEKLAAAQRLAQEKRRQLELALRASSNDLQRALVPVLQDIMKKKSVTLVVDKNQIVLQAGGLDITTEVIEELNRKLPSLKVELPTEQ
ncbi:MAG: OmpH family outer membrane protein [Sphingomonadales bacterium]